MALYYFDIYNDEITLDPEGIELPDDAAALARALVEARSIAAESVRLGHLIRSHHIEVRDADRKPLGQIRFDEAVTIT